MPSGNAVSVWAQHVKTLERGLGPLDNAPFSPESCACLVRQCVTDEDLALGKHIHSELLHLGHEKTTFLMNLIVQLYGNCGAVQDAYATFEAMYVRNVYSWTIMIGVYAQHCQGTEALQLFWTMHSFGAMPNKVTYVTIISVCAKQGNLAEGRMIHSCIEKSSFKLDINLGNALVNMYDRCGSIIDASVMFKRLTVRNVISWNTMIAAYVHQGHCTQALELFQQMQSEGILPNDVTYLGILEIFSSQSALQEAKKVHTRIVFSDFDHDSNIGTAIICMYGKCNSIDDAWLVFDDILNQCTISWNAVLTAFGEQDRGEEALQLFRDMELKGVIADKTTFVTMFSLCANQASLIEGKRMHTTLMHCGYEWDVVVWNALTNMYGKHGSLKNAMMLFQDTPSRDVVSWSGIIAAHVQHEQGDTAIQFFQQMQLESILPRRHTFASLMDACASMASLAEGKRAHACVACSNDEGELLLSGNPLRIGESCEQKVSSHCAVAGAHVCREHSPKNSNTNYTISQDSNLVVGNALVKMYSKFERLDDAHNIFNKLPKRDIISWTAMTSAFAQQGNGEMVLQLLKEMQDEGISPNKVTYICILDAFAMHAALVEGQCVHARLVVSHLGSDVEVGNTLMSMYSKCGSPEDAQRVFDTLFERNIVSWTAIIAACALNGLASDVFKLLEQMELEGMFPNEATFVVILSACSHAALVDEACHLFTSMCCDYCIGLTLEHYNCMIDLFGRAGNLEEGQHVIHNMPMEPNALSWMTLLGACKMHLDVERAKSAARRIFELDPNDATPYVLLSNINIDAMRQYS